MFVENLVRGLDDDEAGFLDFVDKTKLAEESRILQEERDELEEYRKAVAKENEERMKMEVKSISSVMPSKHIQLQLPSIGVSKESQKSKLNACVVKRKSIPSSSDSSTSKKVKKTSGTLFNNLLVTHDLVHRFDFASHHNYIVTSPDVVAKVLPGSDLKCIAILPGIGCYDDESSNSDSSIGSSEDIESSNIQFDLCGRPINENADN